MAKFPESVPVTGILLSIRSPQEAQILRPYTTAIEVLDLKEPQAGSLGAPGPEISSEILSATSPQQIKSVALGELLERQSQPAWESLEWAWLSPFCYAKIGLAGVGQQRLDWQTSWLNFASRIPPSVRLVGVAYADWQRCGAPRIEEVLELVRSATATPAARASLLQQAAKSGSQVPPATLLIDTFHKSAGSSIEILGWNYLAVLIDQAHVVGVQIVIAGSLELNHLERLCDLRPDLIGFRGAVCQRGRGQLCVTKVAALLDRWNSLAPRKV